MDQQDKKYNQLEQQLRESEQAEEYIKSDTGNIAIRIATVEIQRLVKQICSEDFLKDHMGYVNAVSKLHARQDWLKRIQVAASEERRAKLLEILREYEDG